MRLPVRDVPTRATTGAYILHAGWDKWHGSEELADGVHGMAAGAFPLLRKIPPKPFLKALAATEIATGAALLAPVVPNRLAGASLTAFAGGLMTMYLRTPAMHKPGSIWPTSAGTGISKDVWMLGIGLGLLIDAAARAEKPEADAEHPDVLADACAGRGGPDAAWLVHGGGAQVHRHEAAGEGGEGRTGKPVGHEGGEQRGAGGDLRGGQRLEKRLRRDLPQQREGARGHSVHTVG